MKKDIHATSTFNLEYYSCTRPEIQALVKPSARKILDVGCAAGMLGYELKQKLGAEVWGVEYVPRAAEQAEKRLDRVLQGAIEDALPLLPDDYFDTIILADVLEHLVEPGEVLHALQDKLTCGGEIVASVPNIRHWSIVKRLLEGRWEYVDAGILDRTHLRFFTWHDCILMFENAGYRLRHGEATLLNGDTGIPESIVTALGKAGLNVGTLAEESQHYQFLVVAVPVARQPGRADDPPPQNNEYADSCSASQAQTGLTSIIMLTWNQLEFTQACLESLALNTPEPYQLIMVDNGSSDGTVQWLREQAGADSRIIVIENSTNRGFAAGCNQGISVAQGEFILLLNNDTVVTPGWLSGMRELFDRYPDAGIVGPMTNSASGIQVVADIGYHQPGELPSWSDKFRELHRYRVIPQRRIVGFCMLFRSSLPGRIGLLDESFGSGNYEDDDYCLRTELAGYRNLVAGDVFIHHEGGATFSGNRLQRDSENRKNRTIFKQKWEPALLEESQLRKWLALNAMEDAEKLVRQGDVDAAVQKLLTGAIRCDSAAPAPYNALANTLIAAQRYDEALQVVREMPADAALVHEIEAQCYCALGDTEAAEKAVTLALRKERPHPLTLVVKGTLAARQGNSSEADACFRRAIDSDPSCCQAWLCRGMLLWGQGNHDEAWTAIRRSAVVGPLHQDSINICRNLAERVGRLSDVSQIVCEASRIYPDSRFLALEALDLRYACGSGHEALAMCEAFLIRFGLDGAVLTRAMELRDQFGLYNLCSAADKESISLCMIVKDEEKHLARCIGSARPAVHEIIVVDTGSSDRTREIAKAFGASVLSFPWTGDFSAARNFGLKNAAGAWILVLDADEVISASDYDEIRRSVAAAAGKRQAWSVMTRNYTTKVNAQGWTANDGVYPDEEAADGWHPSWKVRLFPRHPDIRFSGEVHEMVEKSLLAAHVSVHKARFVIHHYGGLEQDERQVTEKRRRYFEIGMQKLKQNPDDLIALTELAVQAGEIGSFEEAIRLWDRVLELMPDNSEALFNKGYALMGLLRYDEALIVSEKVLGLAENHKEAAFNFATCSLYAGDPERGLLIAEEYSMRNPDYPPLYAALTVLHLAAGKPDHARQTIEKLRQRNYAISDYIRDRAAILDRLGRAEMAERVRQGWIGMGLEHAGGIPAAAQKKHDCE